MKTGRKFGADSLDLTRHLFGSTFSSARVRAFMGSGMHVALPKLFICTVNSSHYSESFRYKSCWKSMTTVTV